MSRSCASGCASSLANVPPRWGYRRLHVLLQREAGADRVINRKRVYRLYRLDGRAIRRRPRKRVVAVVPRGVPIRS
jgi:putative transposase